MLSLSEGDLKGCWFVVSGSAVLLSAPVLVAAALTHLFTGESGSLLLARLPLVCLKGAQRWIGNLDFLWACGAACFSLYKHVRHLMVLCPCVHVLVAAPAAEQLLLQLAATATACSFCYSLQHLSLVVEAHRQIVCDAAL